MREKRNPIISVIVPVYNVNDYFEYCLDSILKQTFQDFEVILVNDGSTDGSAVIANDYKAKDKRIRVINSKNAGVAIARNTGLAHAKGEYVAFIDADDFVNEDYLLQLYDMAQKENADISICSYFEYQQDSATYLFPILEEYESKVMSRMDLYKNFYNPVNNFNKALIVPWGKLFKTSLFKNIKFPAGKYFEDAFTIYKLFFIADKVVYLNKALYGYRIRNNSIMTSDWTREKIRDVLKYNEERISLIAMMGIPITEEHRNDYMACLYTYRDISLQKGFIDEYNAIIQKIEVLEKNKIKE